MKLLKWAKYQGDSQVTNATVLTWLGQLENEEKTDRHRKIRIARSGDLSPEAIYDTQLTGWWGYCTQLNKEAGLANLHSSSLGAASIQEKTVMDIFSTHCQYSHSDPGKLCHPSEHRLVNALPPHGDEALGSLTWHGHPHVSTHCSELFPSYRFVSAKKS